MTRQDILEQLAAIEQAINNRVEIWRVIVNERGEEIGRIYRGSFSAHRDSRIGEPRHQENAP